MISEKPLIISLDIGTTALKVGLFSIEGNLLHIETREQELLFLPEDKVEQNPHKTWSLLSQAVRGCMKGHDSSMVKAISLSVQRGTVVPLDKTGNPVTNQIVWMDKRGLPLTKLLAEKIGQDIYYDISGHPISYITGVSKVLWFYKNNGELWEKIRVLAPPQTLFLKWLGCEGFFCDLSSGTYLFPFDVNKKVWSSEIADKLNFPLDHLPTLVKATDIVGELSQKAARDINLPAGIPIVAGGGDGQCAGVGSGVVEPGLLMINIGTGAGVQTYLSSPIRDQQKILNCAAHVDPIGWEMEGHTQSSGAAFRWFRDEFGGLELLLERNSNHDAFDLLVDQAVLAKPGANGLLFIPTFNGSIAPILDQNARAVLMGLSLSHQKKHVIRALLEGISFEIRWMLDAIIGTGVEIKDIILVGGGAKNKHWNQIHADILNRPVRTIQTTDAALVGAAMCAAVAIGVYTDIREASQNFVHTKEIIEPLQKNVKIYQDTFNKYCRTFLSLSKNGIFEDLLL